MKIKFQPAMPENCNFIWQLRNQPNVRAVSCHSAPIRLADFQKLYENTYTEYSIILIDGHFAGYWRTDEHNFVSIALSRKYRHKGIGEKIIGMTEGRAIILAHNFNSLGAFVKGGYKIKGFYLEK